MARYRLTVNRAGYLARNQLGNNNSEHSEGRTTQSGDGHSADRNSVTFLFEKKKGWTIELINMRKTSIGLKFNEKKNPIYL